jgi:flagellar biosynthetic protein FliP
MKFLVLLAILIAFAVPAFGQEPLTSPLASSPLAPSPLVTSTNSTALPFTISVGGAGEQGGVATAIQVVAMMTILTLAPSIVMLMTSFTRIVIVLGFVRTALGVQNAPSNQIIVGLALFLTIFIMAPIGTRINSEAIQPYMAKKIPVGEAYDKAAAPLKQFMLKQTRPSEIDFFLGVSGAGPTKVQDLSMATVVPAFVVSELRTAFQMGFLIFIPFLIIDFIVSSALMSMGMMMMPPTMIAMPFKLLLFVLVDGWHLVIRSLVESFGL